MNKMAKKDHLLLHYRRGDVVRAIRHINAADVPEGTLGVVFEEAEYHEEATGPMVRWLPSADYTPVCNVYAGDVKLQGS